MFKKEIYFQEFVNGGWCDIYQNPVESKSQVKEWFEVVKERREKKLGRPTILRAVIRRTLSFDITIKL